MKLEFSVYRYNPDVDDAPRMQDYTLEAEEGRDMMLLDALIQLKRKRSVSVVPSFLPWKGFVAPMA
ncbi:Succinate dehydrogenase iron-sulfur subunit [Kluyvera cryocrescens]|uniref:Succinate dehydrogenase iron-sulfur subunit n=1 Tax=Kluyvera cryocrescens TaxID=580 RepID=A0A485CM97_KLUCR|nr:Succinate dehydrogenase iron-sulfur subunit [Kluyvera cryocrescens]